MQAESLEHLQPTALLQIWDLLHQHALSAGANPLRAVQGAVIVMGAGAPEP